MVDGRPATYDYTKASEVILADMHPKVYGGVNTSVQWKGINLALNFTYRLGSKTYNAVARDVNDGGYYWERIMSQTAYNDTWRPTNTNATYAQRIADDLEDVNQKSSMHLFNGNFLRLKNVTLSYNLPSALVSKAKMSNVRVYFNASNLFTIAKNKEYDPEVNSYYTRGWEIPLGKTYTFGIELSF